MKNDDGSKQKIIQTVRQMIEKDVDINKITVRAIAAQAEIGVGLINYHFGSKDKLIGDVLAEIMTEEALEKISQSLAEPKKENFKAMLNGFYDLTIKYEEIEKFLIKRCLTEGDFSTEIILLPLLKQIFGESKTELELKIIAMQIIIPLQSTGLNLEGTKNYCGLDLYNREDRVKFIDILTENIMG